MEGEHGPRTTLERRSAQLRMAPEVPRHHTFPRGLCFSERRSARQRSGMPAVSHRRNTVAANLKKRARAPEGRSPSRSRRGNRGPERRRRPRRPAETGARAGERRSRRADTLRPPDPEGSIPARPAARATRCRPVSPRRRSIRRPRAQGAALCCPARARRRRRRNGRLPADRCQAGVAGIGDAARFGPQDPSRESSTESRSSRTGGSDPSSTITSSSSTSCWSSTLVTASSASPVRASYGHHDGDERSAQSESSSETVTHR